MRRRTLLGRIGTVTGLVAATAGCLSPADGIGDGDGGETDTERPVLQLIDAELDATDPECGGDDAAEIEDATDEIRVVGTIRTSDLCSRAALDESTYDADADELRVRIITEEFADVCGQCIATSPYDATIRFDGGTPGQVVVHHDDRRIADWER